MRIDYRPPAAPGLAGYRAAYAMLLMARVHALPSDNIVEHRCARRLPRRAESHSDTGRIRAHPGTRDSGAIPQRGAFSTGYNPDGRVGRRGQRHAAKLPVDPAAFVLDFLPFEERVIRRDGVRLFNVAYFDGALAPLLDSSTRKCRIKYHPRNMSAVFVELPTGGHLRLLCADLGRPAVTLWEQRAAIRTLRAEGRASVDEAAIFAAIEAQRRVLADAQASSKTARRATARLPGHRSVGDRIPRTRRRLRRCRERG